MTSKKIEIILFLISISLFFILPIHETHAQTSKNTGMNSTSETIPGLESIRNIEKIIGENTPEFIAKPIILTATRIEKWRSDTVVILKNKKETAQSQIKVLDFTKNNTEKNPPDSGNQQKTPKLLKNIELFLFTFLSFVFNNKFIFYGVLSAFVFMVLRYIWDLIF